MNSIFLWVITATTLLTLSFISSRVASVPVGGRRVILIPVSRAGSAELGENAENRQGLIAQWIQSSQFFPVEVNVPDLISNATSGIQNFSQNVGQTFQTFGQNLGQGYQTWISNLGQRFPFINRLPIPGVNNNNKPQKYILLVPMNQADYAPLKNSQPDVLNGISDTGDGEELFTYP